MAAWWDGTNVKYKLVYDSIGVGPHYRSTGIDNITTEDIIAVYPNPAGNQISISGIEDAIYIIKNIAGRTVASGIQKDKQPLDITAFAPGSYLIEITKKDKRQTLRFTKH